MNKIENILEILEFDYLTAEQYDYLKKYVNQCSREFDVIRKNLEIALDKMNELEKSD